MSAVPISELFRVLLPRDRPNGWLGMLAAYFDDSGTHTGGRGGPSKVVIVAGLVGTETRLTYLERNWQRHLDRPLCGRKDRLSRFHMVDCNESRGEFAGWSRTETDYFCQQLRETIIEAEVALYGVAIARQDWDELITGDVRRTLGDAEGYCISQCFVCALRWARANTFDPRMTFVFDKRIPEIERRARAMGDAFERYPTTPQVVGTAFLSSAAVLPLQAADLFAWELYQHCHGVLLGHSKEKPRRRELNHLYDGVPWVLTQIAERPQIERLAEYVRNAHDPETLRQMGDHFSLFDPDRPDYSHLLGGRPS